MAQNVTFSNTPHLVVVREANPDDGTDLHEFWQLESYTWVDGVESIDCPPVRVYVAPWSGGRDTGKNGLPPKESRTMGSCSWDEVPEEVRQQFREEANKLQQATATFQVSE